MIVLGSVEALKRFGQPLASYWIRRVLGSRAGCQKKALKRGFRPRAPIPNCPDSGNSDTSTLVGEDTDDGVVTVLLKKEKQDHTLLH